MERLWTPWRMTYIAGLNEPPPDCFLCEHPGRGAAEDASTLILQRDEHAFAILNLYPYNTAHTVVAPYLHEGRYEALPDTVRAAMGELVARVVAAIDAEYGPQGFNVGMNLGRVAGAGVPDHVHQHVVPRWAGDANFMTTVGETKVLPETLERTYERLRPHFA